MVSYSRKPYDFLMVSFALLLNPSTIPLETDPLARNQLSNSSRCERKLRATFFSGGSRERMTREHHSSRNRPAQAGDWYSQKR